MAKYVVQKGDSLSKIANTVLGDPNLYKELVELNKIENPNLIYVGQEINIPDKFDKPLTLEEIPTKDKVNIIDNYSPNYDYIVEGDKIYYSKKGNHGYFVDISDNDVARRNLFNFLHDNYDFKGYTNKEREIYNKLQEGTYDYNKRNSREKSPLVEKLSKNLDVVRPLEEYASSLSAPNVKLDYNGSAIKVSPDANLLTYLDNFSNTVRNKIRNAYNNIIDLGGKGLDLGEKGINYITRQWDKAFADDENVSTLNPKYDTIDNSQYGIIPDSYTGDTINVNDRQYILPESIDLTNTKLGVRNRGDYTPINTEAGIVTNFHPYGRRSTISTPGTYMGVDSVGNFKVGPLESFNDNDFITRTYENELVDFLKDKNGSQVYKNDAVHGNASRSVPVVRMINEKGDTINGSLNILTDRQQKGNTYGNITGGRLIVKADNEIRLLSGSIDDLEKQIENIKKRHSLKSVKVYTLDNGSYNRGIRTRDRQLTARDLRGYDNQNNGGGNFMYILPNQNVFASDTVRTPNIRTKADESYKKGHSLTNEQKGVVLHHTAFMDDDLTNVTRHLTDKKSEASSHVIIGFDGKRRVLAEPDKVTFHAGYSRYNNRNDVNDFMIGIEFQGDTSKKNLTKNQIDSAVEYLAPILRKNNISLENVTTHERVRDLYNKYQLETGGTQAPNKPDITFEEYQKVIDALKKKLYYKK